MEAFLDLAGEMDHVFTNSRGTQPDHPGNRSVTLKQAIATPAHLQTAPKHDDDFRVARLDLAEIALRMVPAFRQQAFPSPPVTGSEPDPCDVLRPPMSSQMNHATSTSDYWFIELRPN